MEKGHVTIPIGLYDKLKEFESKQSNHAAELKDAKDSCDAKVKEAYADICKFVREIGKEVSPHVINAAADNVGFIINVNAGGHLVSVGNKGKRVYNFNY